MDNQWNYKNFNMSIELDVAGEFIYNGIDELNRMDCLSNNAPAFIALYSLAVGIERLQKIILVLWKYDRIENKNIFQKDLITHSHSILRGEITKYTNKKLLNKEENEFITLIDNFYKEARYERFNVNGKIGIEIKLWDEYIKKYIKDISLKYPFKDLILSYEIKEFLGKVIGNISRKYYSLILEGSLLNNTFTYELRSDSKAEKVFLGDYNKNSLIEEKYEEKLAFKEFLVYLRNSKEKSGFFNFLDDIKPLDFDSALVIEYIEEISNGVIPRSLIDNVKQIYSDNGYKPDRKELIKLIGNPYVSFEQINIFKCYSILNDIIQNNTIEESMINTINDYACYIDDEKVLKVIDKINRKYNLYHDGKMSLDDLLKILGVLHVKLKKIL